MSAPEKKEEVKKAQAAPTPEVKAPEPAPAPKPAPPTKPPKAETMIQPAQSLPVLKSVHMMSFGRMDSDYRVRILTINIDEQDTLSGATYDQLLQLTTVDLPLTRNQFIQVWKTLLLKRVQDIIEKQTFSRPDHFVRISRNIPLPAPLADLLYSLGQFHSKTNGTIFRITQPARATPPPPYWNADGALLFQWQIMMGRLSKAYVMREYPPPTDWENKAILVTSINDDGDLRSVKSFNNEPTMADAFIRFANDNLFQEQIPYIDCYLRIVEGQYRPTIVGDYVRSYVTDITC